MMKNLNIALFILALFFSLPVEASECYGNGGGPGTHDDCEADAIGHGSAWVLPNLSITLKHSDLDFGTFSVGPTGGTVTNHGASTGDVSILVTGNDGGIWEVAGKKNKVFYVTHDPTVTLSDGFGNTMIATLVDTATHQLDGNGVDTDGIHIHGTLAVGGNQTPGNYSGIYNVTAHY